MNLEWRQLVFLGCVFMRQIILAPLMYSARALDEFGLHGVGPDKMLCV